MAIYRGAGGSGDATNDAAINQIANLANQAAASAAAALASENAAAADEVLTNQDAIDTAADLVLTNADVVLTHADVVLTAANAASTAADVLLTNADVVTTNANAATTTQDAIDTAADAAATAADLVQTNLDQIATTADAASTAADALATAADKVATNADVVLTHADVVLTNADAAATALALDEFTDTYLGAKASAPTLDNDGNALIDGALYFDTTINGLKVYDLGNTVWVGITNYVHPGHTGDVTSTGDGATVIANDAVTYAKLQNISATARVLGRNTAGAGDAEEITEAQFKTLFNLEIGTDVQAYDATNVLDADVTYELLNTNGDVGTGAGQLAIGNHLHTGVYEPADATIVKDADIGVTVQGYDVDTTKDDVVSDRSADMTFNDNVKLKFGTLGANSTIRSTGVHTYWNMVGAAVDLNIQSESVNKFLFDGSSGNFHADGDVIAVSNSVGSDRKIKKDIRPIEDASSKLDSLVGVQYNLKKSGKADAGLIAQDVQSVLPEAVKEVAFLNGEEGETYLSLNYNAVVGLLVAGFQEEKAKVLELEKRILELEK